MNRMISLWTRCTAACVAALLVASTLNAQNSVTQVSEKVNQKMVKLFGIGGFKGLPSYGTGILVSDKGHILTVNNHILNTPGILIHLYDGRQFQAKVTFREPELDVALLKIDDEVNFLAHYDIAKESARPMAEHGDWILAFSNQFKIALRDEPMSVQRGTIMALTDLRGRRGVFDAPYQGDVYFLDVIACNPGAAGGALTNRKGDLLGILGRELKNTGTDTWINYAVPIQAMAEIQRGDKEGKVTTEKVNIAKFVSQAIAGKYVESSEAFRKSKEDKGGYLGAVLIVDAVPRSTPPYVEEVVAGSPAEKAGLRPDDLILYVDGLPVPTIRTFREAMRQYGPEKEVRITYQRGNRAETVTIKLANPPKTAAPK